MHARSVTKKRMSLFVGSTVLDVEDVGRAVAFWTRALGFVVRDQSADFAVLTDPRRRWANVSLQRSAEPKTGVNRVHLDLYADDRGAEVRRLLALGATAPAWSYGEGDDHTVLQDPDGNEFCVVQSPWTQDA